MRLALRYDRAIPRHPGRFRLRPHNLHLERWALHDAHHQGREAVIVLRRLARDGADHRHIVIFGAAARARRSSAFASWCGRIARAWQSAPRAEPSGAVDRGAVGQLRRRRRWSRRRRWCATRRSRQNFRARSRWGPSPCGTPRRRDWRDAAPSAGAWCRRRLL